MAISIRNIKEQHDTNLIEPTEIKSYLTLSDNSTHKIRSLVEKTEKKINSLNLAVINEQVVLRTLFHTKRYLSTQDGEAATRVSQNISVIINRRAKQKSIAQQLVEKIDVIKIQSISDPQKPIQQENKLMEELKAADEALKTASEAFSGLDDNEILNDL